MTLRVVSAFLYFLLYLGMKKGKASASFPYGKDNQFQRRMQI
ncbi:hypothetical protein HMPREF0971_00455 [Segatella oris F0302]|uniref:Uncharacterized protein n=1 Tax=Segatella oris F0302 TaxID=649760 RepID=D1QNB9_9BACT|nr:hypothetical protein HMPREF0971_00455 [Segatella oris F0302]